MTVTRWRRPRRSTPTPSSSSSATRRAGRRPRFPASRPRSGLASSDAGVDAYVHAPYVINVASPNNRIRIPSRKLLEQQLAAAAAVGAKGLIVHGGHVTAGVDPEEGYDSWRKAIERIDRPLPMLIENTAGGDGAMARGLDAIARLWEVDRRRRGRRRRGRASAWIPATRSRPARTWRPSSTGSRRSPAGSTWCTATTRATSSARAGTGTLAWTSGTIDPALLVEVVRSAGATPSARRPDAAADVRWLRAKLS